jgi:hypothetical protein
MLLGGNGGGSAPPAELSTLRVLDPAPELLHGDHKPAVLGRSLCDAPAVSRPA